MLLVLTWLDRFYRRRKFLLIGLYVGIKTEQFHDGCIKVDKAF